MSVSLGLTPDGPAQFHPLEQALAAMGVVVWPMIELEADDALASAARISFEDEQVEKIAIWTPDKDLAQCVRDTRVVQIDGRRKTIRDAAGIREKFGVDPPWESAKVSTDLISLFGISEPGGCAISSACRPRGKRVNSYTETPRCSLPAALLLSLGRRLRSVFDLPAKARAVRRSFRCQCSASADVHVVQPRGVNRQCDDRMKETLCGALTFTLLTLKNGRFSARLSRE